MKQKPKFVTKLFAAIDGYADIKAQNEQQALNLSQVARDVIKPVIEQHNGAWMYEKNGEIYANFKLPEDAVKCAVALQLEMSDNPDMKLRIGIHTGDIKSGIGTGDIVASKIARSAALRGICISGKVYASIQNKTDVTAEYLEDVKPAGIEHAVSVYSLTVPGLQEPETLDSQNNHAEKQRTKPSIAVLPFINMSADPEQEYFCDGITEEIINALTNVEDLKIIARTSAFAFKGKQEDIREIGKKLDVENLVEGSVRKAGNRVRITAQFVKVIDGSHMWSQQYDRNMEDIFEIQSDVALNIVEALKSKLSISEKKQIDSIPTDNIKAYDYYLRGNDYSKRSYEEKDLRIAIQMYEKAVEYDPDFALAYAKLGIYQWLMYWFHYDRSKQLLESAKEAFGKSLHLNPNLPEGHLGMGLFPFNEFDYEKALEKFNSALKKSPNNDFLLMLLGCVYRWLGNFEQAVSHITKAIKLDPLNHLYFFELGITYMIYHDFPEAGNYFNRAIKLAPDDPLSYGYKACTYMLWHSDTEKARECLKKAGQVYTLAFSTFIGYCDYPIDVYEENYQEALDELSRVTVNTFEWHSYFITKNQLQARIYGLLGDVQREQEYYNSARGILEDKVQEYPDEARFHGSLAIVYAGLGRKDEALREAKLAIKLNPFGKVNLSGLLLPRVHVMAGEYNKAIDALENELNSISPFTVPLIRIHPDFKPLHSYYRFKALLKKMGMPEN